MSARVITVFSNKGGVGKTFVCVNTATALALSGKRTLVIDLDFQAGQDMARMFNIAPRQSIVDILPELEHSQDPETIKKFVAIHSSGVHFITSVMNIRQAGQVTPDGIKLLFRRISAAYDYIIVDVGKNFTETLLSIFDMSNLILLVATPDILAVYQLRWGLDVLQGQRYPSKMIQMVLNRAESHGGVAWQEVKDALGCDIISRIPSDGKTVGVALNRGIPTVVYSPKAKVSTSFIDLAHELEKDGHYVNTTEVVRTRTAEEKKDDGFWKSSALRPTCRRRRRTASRRKKMR